MGQFSDSPRSVKGMWYDTKGTSIQFYLGTLTQCPRVSPLSHTMKVEWIRWTSPFLWLVRPTRQGSCPPHQQHCNSLTSVHWKTALASTFHFSVSFLLSVGRPRLGCCKVAVRGRCVVYIGRHAHYTWPHTPSWQGGGGTAGDTHCLPPSANTSTALTVWGCFCAIHFGTHL